MVFYFVAAPLQSGGDEKAAENKVRQAVVAGQKGMGTLATIDVSSAMSASFALPTRAARRRPRLPKILLNRHIY